MSNDTKWRMILGHLLIMEGKRYRDASSELARDAAAKTARAFQSAAQSLESYGEFLIVQGNSCIESIDKNSGFFVPGYPPHYYAESAMWLGTEAPTWTARREAIARLGHREASKALQEYGEFLLAAMKMLLERA